MEHAARLVLAASLELTQACIRCDRTEDHRAVERKHTIDDGDAGVGGAGEKREWW